MIHQFPPPLVDQTSSELLGFAGSRASHLGNPVAAPAGTTGCVPKNIVASEAHHRGNDRQNEIIISSSLKYSKNHDNNDNNDDNTTNSNNK